MTRIIAVTNQKGGVGKTTTSINLAASLAATRRKVLMIDLDPQGNATMGSGVDKHTIELSGYHLLLEDAPIDDIIVAADAAGYHMIPGNGDLTAAEVQLMQMVGRESRLANRLKPIAGRYDYILIDCPPALNLLTLNALTAADAVFIPIQCEYYALEGLTALLETVEQVREIVNPRLEVEGLLRTMFDARNNLANEVSEQLLEHFGDKVYRTIIPRNIRLAEAPSYGVPIIKYDQASRGAVAYLALAAEMVRRQKAIEEDSKHLSSEANNMPVQHPPENPAA
ncbi:Chromosome (plasmid) partitioning protein ParA [hydrothermal vent metagenome]|uniref:Chromosome (Plasmid) partitioning protein ParA n=1 Tax=hydrothermal vent metagenome TaxID=652676 RepID=A0A3B0YET0_9ZZZZ